MFNPLALLLVNRALTDDPWAASRLALFSGSTLLLLDVNKSIAAFKIQPNGLLDAYVIPEGEEPTLSIELPTGAAMLFLSHGRKGVIKAAKIRGNIDLANELSCVMEQIQLDPEAFMARRIGDVPAHRLFRLISGIRDRATVLGSRLKHQFSEHVAEGHSVIVPMTLINRFMQDVDTLRNDVARLEQRIKQLDS